MLHSGLGSGCDAILFLSVNKLGSKSSKNPCFRMQMKQMCMPLSSLLIVYPQFGKASGWDYYFSTAGMNVVCQDLCAGYCKRFLALPSQISGG